MTEPLKSGDELEIVHMSGRRQKVKFAGLYGTKLNIAYITWPSAGQYRVKFETGQLMPKRASLWALTKPSLERVRATQSHAKDRRKSVNR